MKQNEVFVDCGVYIGDSVCSFIKVAKSQNIKYKKIIAFEPDINNYKKLRKCGVKNLKCYNSATSDKKAKLNFSSAGTTGSISKKSRTKIDACALDEIIYERITYLKMDVEGYELKTLKGAKSI